MQTMRPAAGEGRPVLLPLRGGTGIDRGTGCPGGAGKGVLHPVRAELRQGAAFCVRCGAGGKNRPSGNNPQNPCPNRPTRSQCRTRHFASNAVRSWRKGRYSASCAGQGRIAKRLLWLQPPKGNSSPCHLNLPKRRKKAASLPLYCRCSCWRLRWGR